MCGLYLEKVGVFLPLIMDCADRELVPEVWWSAVGYGEGIDGCGGPFVVFHSVMCGCPGGFATVLTHICWISRAGGSCGWYCRWRKTVCFVLLVLLLQHFLWSSGEHARYVSTFYVAFWKIGVRTLLW